METLQNGLQLVCLTLSSSPASGLSPTLQLTLLVNPATGNITGHGAQKMTVDGPSGDIPIQITSGHVLYSSILLNPNMVSLQGTGAISHPPDTLVIAVPFSAQFAVDNAWNGNGGWTLASQSHNDQKVQAVTCTS
jgi:hypothetical protein